MELVTHLSEHLKAALWNQERTLSSLGVSPGSEQSQINQVPLFFEARARQNLALTRELTYDSEEHSRPAISIISELKTSIAASRAILPSMSASFGGQTPVSIRTPTHIE